MKVMVIGSGGREHALAWRISMSKKVRRVLVYPGNGGMKLSPKIKVKEGELTNDAILKEAFTFSPDLIVIGPEKPLANGITDLLEATGFTVCGPSAEAAKLESSKVFSKGFMKRHGIPTGDYASYENYEDALEGLTHFDPEKGLVVKADGLASGKGVVVADTLEEAKGALYDFMKNETCSVKASEVLLEERLEGREVSAFALCDGENFIPLGYVCDYKRALDGNTGPNTGGMGCYTPKNWPTLSMKRRIETEVFKRVLDGMKKEGRPFKGILFAGLMIEGDVLNVIEFNVRFGDPETQTLLPILEGDLFMGLYQAARGELQSFREKLWVKNVTAVHVVMTSQGYPETHGTGMHLGVPIDFDPELVAGINKKGPYLFFSGVKLGESSQLENSGGRVLGITSLGDELQNAREMTYHYIHNTHFEGAHYRNDIASI